MSLIVIISDNLGGSRWPQGSGYNFLLLELKNFRAVLRTQVVIFMLLVWDHLGGSQMITRQRITFSATLIEKFQSRNTHPGDDFNVADFRQSRRGTRLWQGCGYTFCQFKPISEPHYCMQVITFMLLLSDCYRRRTRRWHGLGFKFLLL